MKSKLFFVGVLIVGLFCGIATALAEENGTEECDAVFIEKERRVLVNTYFLWVIRLGSDVKGIVAGRGEEESSHVAATGQNPVSLAQDDR